MKKQVLYGLGVSLLCLGCGGPDSLDQSQSAASAGANEAYLARDVVGVYSLSADAKYDKVCNVLDNTYIGTLFDVEAGEGITNRDRQTGCEFIWGGKTRVNISTTGHKPFQSIYHAEFYFDSLYQPNALAERRRNFVKPSLFGPAPAGLGAEGPTIGEADKNPAGARFDSSAVNDSSQSVSQVTTAAVMPTSAKGYNTNVGKAISGVGDKAIWEEAKRTLHVLYNNHVIHVMVNNAPSAAADLNRAKQVALVFLSKITEEAQGGITTPPVAE